VSGARALVDGGCHCGNLRLQVQLTGAARDYQPRACDCDFCRKHGAAYLSDRHGSVRISVQHERLLGRYRQGSGNAEMLLCRNCGVLVGACYHDGERLYGVVNVGALADRAQFDAQQVVSPQQLSAAEKVQRWRGIWFPDVSIIAAEAAGGCDVGATPHA
jgi:hypothetical protein